MLSRRLNHLKTKSGDFNNSDKEDLHEEYQ